MPSTIQSRIQKPVEHLRWSLFAKIVNSFQPFIILAEKLHRQYSTGFYKRFCNATQKI